MRFCSWWTLFVMYPTMAVIAKDAAEVLAQDPPEHVVDVTTVPTAAFAGRDTETTTTPYAEAETTTTTTTTTTTPYAEAETTTPYADTETTTVVSAVTADVPSSVTANATVATETPQDGRRSEDELRERMVRLTDELNGAIAALTIAQRREEHLAALEKERCGYLKTLELKLMLLVDNAKNAKVEMADDTYREQHIQQRLFSANRMKDTSSRRLQVVRRLLSGAKVGLAHMEGAKELNACDSDRKKHEQQQQQPSEP